VAKPDAKPPEPAKGAVKVATIEDKVRAQMGTITDKDFYKVGWTRETGDILAPSARVLQKWSNDRDLPVSTRIIRSETTDTGCSVTVRGWIGDEATPLVVKEETVSMHWAHELEWLLAEAVKHGITLEEKVGGQWQRQNVMPEFDLETDANGIHHIVLRNPRHQLHVLAQWYRARRFGERNCTTKCESRLHRKLLSGEWRDEEEIEHEKSEMRAVASEHGVAEVPESSSDGSPESPPPTERLIPKVPAGTERKRVSPMAIASLTTRFRDLGEKFPLPPGVSHAEYLLYATLGLMRERGAEIPEAKLEVMSPADNGRLWELIGLVAKGDEAALGIIDALYTQGVQVAEAIKERVA
jgi:hypothetical protein